MVEGAKFYTRSDNIKRWIPSVLMIPVCWYFITTDTYTYLDYFHLIVHEAGHAMLGFIHEVVTALGGTIMQLIIPVLLIIYFFVNYMRKSLQAALFLEGHSFLNVSIYAADAKDMKLELFGPPNAKHDWNWILTHFDALDYTGDVAMFFRIMAGFCFLAAILVPWYIHD